MLSIESVGLLPVAIMGLSPMELTIIFVIILVLFGARRIPELGRSLGSGLRNFKKGISGEDEEEAPHAPPRALKGEDAETRPRAGAALTTERIEEQHNHAS